MFDDDIYDGYMMMQSAHALECSGITENYECIQDAHAEWCGDMWDTEYDNKLRNKHECEKQRKKEHARFIKSVEHQVEQREMLPKHVFSWKKYLDSFYDALRKNSVSV